MTLEGDNILWPRLCRLTVCALLFLGANSIAGVATGEETGWQTIAGARSSAGSTVLPAPVLVEDALPATANAMIGDEVVFTAVFSNFPAANFQWQKMSNGVALDIPKATATMLTLANLQPADSGYYRLKAVNATNRQAVTYTSARPLAVDRIGPAANNVLTIVATQTGLGGATAFTPTWKITTGTSLIAGQSPSSASGNFSLEASGRNVNSLTGGGDLMINRVSGDKADSRTCNTNYVTCGDNYQAGSSVTYTLAGTGSGYTLTNITVYGGWSDHGRDQQAYTVYFSTVSAPDLFLPLCVINYNPSAPDNVQSATRVSLRPANGVLARNVAAVKFDFTNPASKNGFSGYSQIVLSGYGSAALPPARPLDNNDFLTVTGAASALNDVDLLGSWIWDSKTFDAQTCQFWRTFDIPAKSKVSKARLFMTVDNEFIFLLDGRELGRGDDWHELFDYDLTSLLGPGRHVLAITAYNSFNQAGMILGLRADLADGRFVEIKSDQNWRIVPNGTWKWENLNKKNAAWPAATVVGPLGTSPWWERPVNINRMIFPPTVRIFFWQEAWFQITFLTLSGISLLTIFFLAAQIALHQKERRLLQSERARIAMDIHDDIGSRITQLVLNGEDAQEGLPEDSKVRLKLAKIWDEARDVLSSIDEILWALNPRLDTLHDFANYVCDYAQKVLEPSAIACTFDVDSNMPVTAADLPLRRSLLMAMKETLNNIVKHSGATEVHLKIKQQHQHLIVVVLDNGRGFDLTAIKPGRNGLRNMSGRMRELGGSCHFSSQPGKGCRIAFDIPLKRSRKFSWLKKWHS
jgi:signal transduction histidine kinase